MCNDEMLHIIGVKCHNLSFLDIWKSSNVTDTCVKLSLGLDIEKTSPLCPSLRYVEIKGTSVTDKGAFQLMIHCANMYIIQY